MGIVKKAYITFDVDFVDYLNNTSLDELEIVFPMIKTVLENNLDIKTTWFIRIDSQVEEMYGNGDFLYNKHIEKINWLKKNGHAIGWHHHSYKMSGDNWIQNTNEDIILEELRKYGPLAKALGMNICRMGWGFHTNKTMKSVSDMGFRLDSSAIPRPNYKWELSVKDWQTTPQQWYNPSADDYRIPGEPRLTILEAPMSTTEIQLSIDTEENVIRYLNPAYHEQIFSRAFDNLSKLDRVITITHPYELIQGTNLHMLLSFDIKSMKNNLDYIRNAGYEFETLK